MGYLECDRNPYTFNHESPDRFFQVIRITGLTDRGLQAATDAFLKRSILSAVVQIEPAVPGGMMNDTRSFSAGAFSLETKIPIKVPATIGVHKFAGWLIPDETFYLGFAELTESRVKGQSGIVPRAMWRAKYLPDGGQLPGDQFLQSLHRKASGNEVLIVQLTDDAEVRTALSRMEKWVHPATWWSDIKLGDRLLRRPHNKAEEPFCVERRGSQLWMFNVPQPGLALAELSKLGDQAPALPSGKVMVIDNEPNAAQPFLESIGAARFNPWQRDGIQYKSLCHPWQFRYDPANEGIEKEWYRSDLDDSAWDLFPVPGNHGFGLAWYRTTVELPPLEGRHVYFLYDGMFMNMDVYVNGQLAARTFGVSYGRGRDSKFDITPLLRPGLNSIVVRADGFGLSVSGGLFAPVFLALGPPMSYGEVDKLVSVTGDVLPESRELLRRYDTIVLSSNVQLSYKDQQQLQEFVRRGGGLLMITGNRGWGWYQESPIDEVSPTHLDCWKNAEMLMGFFRGTARVEPVGESPLVAGIDWKHEPRLAYLQQFWPRDSAYYAGKDFWGNGTGLANGKFAMLSADWKVHLRSTHAIGYPVLLSSRYGAGKVLLFTSNYGGARQAGFTSWSGYDQLWSNCLVWLKPQRRDLSPSPPANATSQPPRDGRTAQLTFNGQAMVRYRVFNPTLCLETAGDVAGNGSAMIPLFSANQRYNGNELSTQFESSVYADRAIVRVALLDGSQSPLEEKTFELSLAPDGLSIQLSLDNVYEREQKLPIIGMHPPRTPEQAPIDSVVYFPGETMHATVKLTSATEKPIRAVVKIELERLVQGQLQELVARTVTVSEAEPVSLTASAKLTGSMEFYRLQVTVNVNDRQRTMTRIFDCIEPWRRMENLVKMFPRGHDGYGAYSDDFNHQGCFGVTGGFVSKNTDAFGYANDLITFGVALGMPWKPCEFAAHHFNSFSFFPNGTMFRSWWGPQFAVKLDQWHGGSQAGDPTYYGRFHDSWDNEMTEACFSWENLRAFDDYLKQEWDARLTGLTHRELCDEVLYKFFDQWQLFIAHQNNDAQRFSAVAIRSIKSDALMNNQTGALLARNHSRIQPPEILREYSKYVTHYEADFVVNNANLIHWEAINSGTVKVRDPQAGVILHNCIPQAGFTPGWKVAELNRRKQYDSLWMGFFDDSGQYRPIYEAGHYGHMASPTGRPKSWAFGRWYNLQINRLAETIGPVEPIGAIYVECLSEPRKDRQVDRLTTFENISSPLEQNIRLFSKLRDAGAVISGFVLDRNVKKIPRVDGLLVMPGFGMNPSILKEMADRQAAGTPLALVHSGGGLGFVDTPLSRAVGVKATLPVHGQPWEVLDHELTKEVAGLRGWNGRLTAPHQLWNNVKTEEGFSAWHADEATDLVRLPTGHSVLAIQQPPTGGRTGFYAPGSMEADEDTLKLFARVINWSMGNPLMFPDGVTGYGFRAKGMTFVIAEELRYQSRNARITIKLPAGSYRAFDLNENRRLKSQWENEYLNISLPLRAGSATLIAIIHGEDQKE